MSIVVLIPALVCTVTLFLAPPAWVFRNIVLPVLLLCPMIYFWKLALLPPIDFADAVLLPVGLSMVVVSLPRWRLSAMDVWMLLFLFSSGWADHNSGLGTASTFEFFDAVCCVLVPYMAGKLLIEQEEGRNPTVRRTVMLLFSGSLIASYEYFAGQNAFEIIFSKFFPEPIFYWASQFRDKRARITGPFWQAELAGTMIVLGILLTVWLALFTDWGKRFRELSWLPVRKATVVGGTLVVALVLTQSRGPELGLLFGLPIALIGRSRHVARAAVLVTILLIGGGAGAYLGIMKYAGTATPGSEQQQSARYRAIMLDNYLPMAETSGPWGSGPSFPRVGGQISIDNEYLWLALTQGWVGLGSFILLSVGTIYRLVRVAVSPRDQADRAFAFTMLGAFLGILFILATVFLAYQPRIFFFLFVGWVQAIEVRRKPWRPPALAQIYT